MRCCLRFLPLLGLLVVAAVFSSGVPLSAAGSALLLLSRGLKSVLFRVAHKCVCPQQGMALFADRETLEGFSSLEELATQINLLDPAKSSLFTLFDVEPSDHPQVLGAMTEADFRDIITQWRIINPLEGGREALGEDAPLGAPPTPGQVAKAGMLARACRLHCKNELFPEELAEELEKQRAHEIRMAELSSMSRGSTEGVEAVDRPTPTTPKLPPPEREKIALEKVINQGDSREIVMLPADELDILWQNYKDQVGDYPEAEEEPSSQQVTAIAYLVDSLASPYVDFAVFGPYADRYVKKARLSGMIIQPDGTFALREMYGPGSFSEYCKCYAVWKVCLMMKQAVSIILLDNMLKHFQRLHETFGGECWLMLYQAIVRMFSEQFRRYMREGKDLYYKCIDKKVCPWQPDKPFFYVFQRGLDDGSFWNREFERKATLVLSGAKTPGQLGEVSHPIKGAPIAPSAKRQPKQPAVPSTYVDEGGRDRGNNRPRPYPEQKAHMIVDGAFTHNRSQSKLCAAFQGGSCQEGKGGWCPVNWGERHQCNKCLQDSHGGDNCSQVPRPPSAVVRSPSSKGRGKGGHKGKKGKRAGQG